MKLRNKKTGEIIDTAQVGVMENVDGGRFMFHDAIYDSLTELTEEWEDYEEPKVFYYIKSNGYIVKDNDTITKDFADDLESIGNYFETEEEAEKAVEKLKAWKRLKDAGFKFIGKDYRGDKNFGSAFFQVGEGKNIRDFYQDNQDFYDDLDLLFCPEENS